VFLVAITAMSGDIYVYLAIYIAPDRHLFDDHGDGIFAARATTFNVRRGLALAIFGSSPPIFGALGAPLVTGFVAIHRLEGGLARHRHLLPDFRDRDVAAHPGQRTASSGPSPVEPKPVGVYGAIFTTRAFWILLAAIFSVNMPFTLAVSQLKLVVLEQGLTDSTAAVLVSVFAISSVAAAPCPAPRSITCLAHIVAAIGFYHCHSRGLLLLASHSDSLAAITIALLLIGIFLRQRGGHRSLPGDPAFPARGLQHGAGPAQRGNWEQAMASGNAILGFTLDSTGSFAVYLYCAAADRWLAAPCFLTLGQRRIRRTSQASA